MATTYKYSIIRIEPDARRGERVNVGLVVYRGKDLDIRVVETRKAAAIASKNWDVHIRNFSESLREIQSDFLNPEKLILSMSSLDKQISLTSVGWFEAENSTSYESEVKRILSALVKRPKKQRRIVESNVATEIAAKFKAAKILSSHGETLESGKVVRNFVVDEPTGLAADFALKNGVMHYAATLSLTSSNPHFGTAASKAVTMDLARRIDEDSKTYCVYAVAPSRVAEVKEHIAILGDYSDEIFNWHVKEERNKFQRVFYDAYCSNFPTDIEKQAQH